jgi:oxalate decarboxylase/phosphoglucose isomerase-like protein (cupin superfamily)
MQNFVLPASSIPASLGLYIVTVTFAGGCTVSASTYVELEWIYCTTNTGTTELNCSNASISATAIDTVTSGTYLWSGGTSPNTATNTFTAPGTYTVTVSSTNGSTQTTSVTITQNITPPSVGITNNTGATQLTCALATISVTASPAGAASYAWSGGTTPATANNSFTRHRGLIPLP